MKRILNIATGETLFTGSFSECKAFLKGMYTAEPTEDGLWYDCFIMDSE